MERSVSSTSTKVKILTDDMELEPLLDFKDYGNAIVRIIKDSTPKFSVGIYGEWRTGKTTLMRFIESELKSNSSQADNNVLTVWFNAWRYEREEQFALIALMQTIAYAMGDIPVYHEIKKVLLRGLVIIGKDVMRNLTEKYFFMSKKGIDKLEQTLLHKMELLDKDTIYFDGFYKIEHEMEKLSQTNRIVVFIDDLDRCSPKTTLEVFESIKVFLGMEGFVYVVGLSLQTISKLIAAEYEKNGIKGKEGELYIRKIIQIPITIPEWNDIDIRDLIQNLSSKLDDKYADIVKKNKEVIATAVELNPRETKRFINNFIVAHEIYYKNKEVQAKELLVIQALKVRWNPFYRHFSSNEKFRLVVQGLLSIPLHDRIKLFNLDQIDREIDRISDELINLRKEEEQGSGLVIAEPKQDNEVIDQLRKQREELRKNRQELRKVYEEVNKLPEESKRSLEQIDFELWTFLDHQGTVLFSIKDWKIY